MASSILIHSTTSCPNSSTTQPFNHRRNRSGKQEPRKEGDDNILTGQSFSIKRDGLNIPPAQPLKSSTTHLTPPPLASDHYPSPSSVISKCIVDPFESARSASVFATTFVSPRHFKLIARYGSCESVLLLATRAHAKNLN